MSFKLLYKALFAFAFLMNIADYFITQMAFTRFPVWFEANPYVRILFAYMNPISCEYDGLHDNILRSIRLLLASERLA